MSPDVTPMNYVGKCRHTDNYIIQLSVPNTTDIMPFIRNDDVNGVTHLTWVTSGGKQYVDVSASGADWIYILANIVTVEHGIELAIYDISGRVIQNTGCLSLVIVTASNLWSGSPINSSSTVYDVNVGFPAAAMPGIYSNYPIALNSQMLLYLYGSTVVRTHDNTVGARVWNSQQINGCPSLPKFRVNHIYIGIRLHP